MGTSVYTERELGQAVRCDVRFGSHGGCAKSVTLGASAEAHMHVTQQHHWHSLLVQLATGHAQQVGRQARGRADCVTTRQVLTCASNGSGDMDWFMLQGVSPLTRSLLLASWALSSSICRSEASASNCMCSSSAPAAARMCVATLRVVPDLNGALQSIEDEGGPEL